MKISKGHYVPKELITSEAVHEAVVKCFVAAGFKDERSEYGCYEFIHGTGLCVSDTGRIMRIIWGGSVSCETPLTLQQLFTAENGLQWPDWAECIIGGERFVYFKGDGHLQTISGDFKSPPFDGDVLATRQPKEKEVKTIEDAVIELCGKLPCNTMQHSYAVVEGMLLDRRKSPVECYVCKVEEFESEAKRMGYINGYRWGVEYPTNGKRPDLEDDAEVTITADEDWTIPRRTALVMDYVWDRISSFRITDQRYKPADTSYLNAPTQAQILTHSEERLTHSDWWDYENDKRVANPPVCVNLLFDDSGVMKESVILYIGKEKILATIADGSDTEYCMSVASLDFYYPPDHATRKAKTERENVIEAAVDVICKGSMAVSKDGTEPRRMANALYDAGMLVLPPKKRDAKD